jgi:hypothetical protein
MPLQLRDKSDYIPELTPATNVFKSNLFNTYSLLFAIRRNLRLDPNPRSPCSELESPMAAQNQAAQVNSPSISFIQYLGFQFLPEISFLLSSRSLPPSF